MRKLFVFLFLFIYSLSQAQPAAMTAKLIGPLPAYQGLNSGYKIAFWEFIPPDAQMKRLGTGHLNQKFPLIIDFHGREGQTTSFSSGGSVTTADLPVLYSRTLTSLYQYTTSALVNRRFAAPGRTDSTQFICLFPQTYGGAGGTGNLYTQRFYAYNMIKYARENLSDIIDLSKIYLVGLSQGGGAVAVAMQDTAISNYVAGVVINCPGYITYGGAVPAWGFQNLAKWGGLIILCHAIDDSQTDPNPVTGAGTYYSDRIVDSLYKYHGITTIIFARYANGDHTIWDRIFNPANIGVAYPKTNGNNVTWSIPFQSLLLQYNRGGRVQVVP